MTAFFSWEGVIREACFDHLGCGCAGIWCSEKNPDCLSSRTPIYLSGHPFT